MRPERLVVRALSVVRRSRRRCSFAAET
jgi:hypothetical protein